jgi:hypothetical protein
MVCTDGRITVTGIVTSGVTQNALNAYVTLSGSISWRLVEM